MKGENVKKMTILTDNYHYNHLRNSDLRSFPCNHVHLIRRTRRWKRWFENEVLCVDLVKKGVDRSKSPDQKILASLYMCYLRALWSFDSTKFGKPRTTPIVDFIKKMKCELLEEIENARKNGCDELILIQLLDSFREIEAKINSWLRKETEGSLGGKAK